MGIPVPNCIVGMLSTSPVESNFVKLWASHPNLSKENEYQSHFHKFYVYDNSDLIKRYEDQVERLQFELAESKIERQTIMDKYNEAKQQLQV